MANFASANDLTNDAYNRGKVTVNILTAVPNANTNTTAITWNVVVSDGNSSYGGYNYDSPNGQGAYATGTITTSGTITGTSTVNTGYQSYDFGSGVIASPYFPRTLGTYSATISHITSSGAATVTAAAVLQGNANPLGYASCSTGAVALTDFAGPSQQSAPTVSRVSGTPTSISITMVAPSLGSASLTRYEYSYSTDNSSWVTPISTATSLTATKTGLTSTQGYYVRTRTITWDGGEGSWGYAAWSPSTFIAGIPSTPTAPTISNVVTTNLTLSWTAPSDNGAAISSYTVQASTNGGTSWSNLATGVTSTTYDATGLTIAATYQFRILAINSSGTSASGASSASQFISAYGYRFTSSSTKVAIAMAARYTGNAGDSVVVNGTTYTGWKMLNGIKRYTSTGWSDLQS